MRNDSLRVKMILCVYKNIKFIKWFNVVDACDSWFIGEMIVRGVKIIYFVCKRMIHKVYKMIPVLLMFVVHNLSVK